MSKLSELLSSYKAVGKGSMSKATGQQAAELITADTAAECAFAFDNTEGQLLRVALGMHVAVAPEDTGMTLAGDLIF
jgi:hypothetical protein